MIWPFDQVRTTQPQGAARIDRTSLLGRVLDCALVGSDLSGIDRIGGMKIPLPTLGAGLQATRQGVAVTNNNNVSTNTTVKTVQFPFFMIGYGFFNSNGGNWALGNLVVSGGGDYAQLRLQTNGVMELLIRAGFGTAQSISVSQTTVGVPICCIAQVFSSTDYRFYCNGKQANGSTPFGTFTGYTSTGGLLGEIDGGIFFTGYGQGRTMSDAQALYLTTNPQEIWKLFAKRSNPIFVGLGSPAITAYYPGSDVSVAGWTSSSGGSLYADIDDVSLDRGDYITSPDLSTTATFGWKDSNGNPVTIPAGTWSVDLDAAYFLGASGQVRLVWLDAGGSSVGATSWQTLTSTDTTYTLSITTTGASTQFRYEDAP